MTPSATATSDTAANDSLQKVSVDTTDVWNSEKALAELNDEALAACFERLVSEPDNALLYLAIGLALANRGRHQEAREAFASAVRLGASDWQTQWHLAQSAARIKDTATVDQACAEVLKAVPEFWFARELPRHVRGYYSQIGQDEFIEQFFATHAPRTKMFVEVGAFDGIHYSNVRRMHEAHGWTGVSIEPVQKNFNKLAASYAGSSIQCVRAAVSAIEGDLAINVSTYPHLPDWGSDVASLSTEGTSHWQEIYGAQWTKETVPAKQLTTILDEAGVADFDLLSIDAEGHDLEVLKTLDFSRFQPQLIVVEYGNQRDELLQFLTSKGYRLSLDNQQDLIMIKPAAKLARPPASPDLSGFDAATRERVLTTISCNDCDEIPKVPNAGLVIAGNPPQQVMHNGVRIVEGCYHGRWMTEIIRCLKGHHEPQEEKVFHEVLKHLPENAVMIEAGSFWAYYSLWFHKTISGARNFIIEPNPTKLEIGRRNFDLNGFKVESFHGFIGRTSNPDSIFTDWDRSQNPAPQIAIDQFAVEHRLETIHMLHADIQGAEVDLLLGAEKLLRAGRIHYLFLSTHNDCHNTCLQLLSEFGYHIVADHSIEESTSVDGLIVASSPLLPERLKVQITRKNVAAIPGNRVLSNSELESALNRLNPHLIGLKTLPLDRPVTMKRIDPIELLTPARFDLPAKHLYAWHRQLNVDSKWARELYHAHIRAFSNGTCTEGDGTKSSINDFFNSFDRVLDSVQSRGFDADETLVPVDHRNVLIDGSHRAAACLLHGKPVWTLSFDYETNHFDSEFFKQRGMESKWADAIALHYCRLRKNTYIVTLFPSAVGGDDDVRRILQEHGRIVYSKSVHLNRRGALNFISELYAGESWLGDWSNQFQGAAGKMEPCFQNDGPVRIFVFEADNLSATKAAKERIRARYNIANHSVHINDTHEETVRLAGVLLNENSIHFLNHAEPRNFERFVRHFERYRNWLREQNHDPELFCIDGSAVLAAYGIREVQDLDVLHYGEVDFSAVLPEVNSHNEDAHHHVVSRDEIIFNPEHHFYLRGVKFASLQIIRALKARRDEPKDRVDVAGIDQLTGAKSDDPNVGASISGVRKPKIVALLAARNESARLPFCLRALAVYTDAIVYLDDCSDDGSVELVRSLAAECRVERIITKTTWHRDEPGDRNLLLSAGREIGGTHFVALDADEAFSANCADNDFLRRQLLHLRPGERLALTWIQLWRSPYQYRFDNSIWTHDTRPFAFCDDGKCHYESGFIHTPRAPDNLKGRTITIGGYVHGVLHFQFVNWTNLRVKQAWYRCLERVRRPDRSAAEINAQYGASEDESGLETRPAPEDWLRNYTFFDPASLNAPDERRLREVREWFQTFGADYFAELDIHHVDWGFDTKAVERKARSTKPFLAFPPIPANQPNGKSMITANTPSAANGSKLPKAVTDLLDVAGMYFANGDLKSCRSSLVWALEMAPENPQVLAACASVRFQLQEFAEARQQFEEAAKRDTTNAVLQVQLARTCLELEDIEGFENALARALEIDEDCPEALRLLGDLNFSQGQHRTAANAYERALNRNSSDITLHLLLGNARFSAGEFAEAEQAFENALKLDPTNEVARENLGVVRSKMNKNSTNGSAATAKNGPGAKPSTATPKLTSVSDIIQFQSAANNVSPARETFSKSPAAAFRAEPSKSRTEALAPANGATLLHNGNPTVRGDNSAARAKSMFQSMPTAAAPRPHAQNGNASRFEAFSVATPAQRLFNNGAPQETSRPSSKELFAKYETLFPEVEGWLHWEAVRVLEFFNRLQMAEGVTGNFAEIGAYQGKFTLAMAAFLKPENEQLVVNDIFDNQDLNTSQSGVGATLSAFRRNFAKLDPNPHYLRLAIKRSDALLPGEIGENIRFFSVDGGHSMDETYVDMRIAAETLHPRGIIVLDDYYNVDWPGVEAGASLYFQKHSDLAPLAAFFNKFVFVKRESHAWFLQQLEKHGFDAFCRELGYTSSRKMLHGFEYRSLPQDPRPKASSVSNRTVAQNTAVAPVPPAPAPANPSQSKKRLMEAASLCSQIGRLNYSELKPFYKSFEEGLDAWITPRLGFSITPNPLGQVFPLVEKKFESFHDTMRQHARELIPFIQSPKLTAIPENKTDEVTPYWLNDYFHQGDARLAYAMVACHRPKLIIECGCGNSTKFMRRAAQDYQTGTRIVCIDPEPRANIKGVADAFHQASATTIDPEFFDQLQPGDFLFIDGSHLVMNGSDCVHLFLNVLPRLKPGVWVHIHDVFLPHDYPYELHVECRYNEQYMLAQLFLYSNDWTPAVPIYYGHRKGILPYGGGSFWMRKEK